VRLRDHAYLAKSVPLTSRPRPSLGTLVVLYRHDRWWAAVWQGMYPALAVGAVAVIVAVIVTAGLARRFVRPIQKLGDQTAAIVGGNFQSVAVSARNDEIRDLALAINHMAGRLSQYEKDVRRNEQLRTLGQLGAGIAHQMRNAAAGGRMAVELHQRECPAGPDNESLSIALRQFRLMEAHLQRFLTLGRGEPGRRETVALVPIVEEALDLVRSACRHAGIELSVRASDDKLRISGDAESLHQLVVNLVLNAVEAAAPPGSQPPSAAQPPQIRIDLGRGPGQALLQVKDSGPGPAAHVQERLFEPFVTEKADGTGLGLFVARQIVEAHGGTLTWCRQDGMTCFTAAFPLLEAESPPQKS
jgi:signal transduction histidine kinase